MGFFGARKQQQPRAQKNTAAAAIPAPSAQPAPEVEASDDEDTEETAATAEADRLARARLASNPGSFRGMALLIPRDAIFPVLASDTTPIAAMSALFDHIVTESINQHKFGATITTIGHFAALTHERLQTVLGADSSKRAIEHLRQFEQHRSAGHVPPPGADPLGPALPVAKLAEYITRGLQSAKTNTQTLLAIARAIPAGLKGAAGALLTPGGGGPTVEEEERVALMMDEAKVDLMDLRVELTGATNQKDATRSLAFHPGMDLLQLIPRLRLLRLWGHVRPTVVTSYQEGQMRSLWKRASTSTGVHSLETEAARRYASLRDQEVARALLTLVSERQPAGPGTH
jgi:hypothetical protein